MMAIYIEFRVQTIHIFSGTARPSCFLVSKRDGTELRVLLCYVPAPGKHVQTTSDYTNRAA
ncbi:MAG TPA: hypothetical protein VI670_00785 [Thermoanaerobaculia bacterium]|jgi:hypothetical protein